MSKADGDAARKSESNGTVEGDGAHSAKAGGRALFLLTVGALGVVFGDIGTSPLYAIKGCFHPTHGVPVSRENVLGVMSLVFWALVLIICMKYMVFVTRADNRGEGGILALMSLALSKRSHDSLRIRNLLTVLGLFGAALLYGDGMITPAISVLSAVEGLSVDVSDTPAELATEIAEEAAGKSPAYVVIITVAILAGLFLVQRHGTARIGRVFGPIIVTWFATIGLLGAIAVAREWHVLAAINPYHATVFFGHNGWVGFTVLGSVFLVMTGGETLYADMGHFGRLPIQRGWFFVALPALLLNYFGQGAVLLSNPKAFVNPFYHLVPGWALYPMVVLATAATITASQAVISGAFSLTRQAVQLGYFPRVPIIHTSSKEIGQIYIPIVNAILLVSTVGLVVGFQSSTNLASAYGVAVTTTMVITTLLLCFVMREVWQWRWWIALLVTGGFLIIDLGFWGAAITKVIHGGWFPLVVGVGVYCMMGTWRRGRQLLGDRLRERILSLDNFVESIAISEPHRVSGAAVYMSGNPNGTPPVLLHNLKHNQVLHKTVVFLTIVNEEIPHVAPKDRVKIRGIGHGFYQVLAHYGFMESPSVPAILKQCRGLGLELHMNSTTFFLGRETLIPSQRKELAVWRKRLFAFMSRNAQTATAFFDIPPGQVVELGVRVEL